MSWSCSKAMGDLRRRHSPVSPCPPVRVGVMASHFRLTKSITPLQRGIDTTLDGRFNIHHVLVLVVLSVETL